MSSYNIQRIIFEDINAEYGRGKYGDFEVIIMKSNGYINATKLCSNGGKKYKNWSRLQGSQELIKYFQENYKGPDMVFRSIAGGQIIEIRGTYVHPDLIPHIASWISPAFAFKVSKIVNNFIVQEYIEEDRKNKQVILEKETSIERLERKIDNQSKEIKELLSYGKKTTKSLKYVEETLDETKEILDETKETLDETVGVLDRTEAVLHTIAEHVVPPTKKRDLFEVFVICKLNIINPVEDDYEYKVTCCQQRTLYSGLNRIKRRYKNSTELLRIDPNSNTKNLLHRLKETYSENLRTKSNLISLINGTTEYDLLLFVRTINEQKNDLTTV
jgi:hypothetical protein